MTENELKSIERDMTETKKELQRFHGSQLKSGWSRAMEDLSLLLAEVRRLQALGSSEVEAEREACAQIADRIAKEFQRPGNCDAACAWGAGCIADAIRARGKTVEEDGSVPKGKA